jgi:hypothetical protein
MGLGGRTCGSGSGARFANLGLGHGAIVAVKDGASSKPKGHAHVSPMFHAGRYAASLNLNAKTVQRDFQVTPAGTFTTFREPYRASIMARSFVVVFQLRMVMLR